MANFCVKCGASLSKDLKFCTNCGHKIEPNITIQNKPKEIKKAEVGKKVEITSEKSQDVKKVTKVIEEKEKPVDKKNQNVFIFIALIVIVAGLAFLAYKSNEQSKKNSIEQTSEQVLDEETQKLVDENIKRVQEEEKRNLEKKKTTKKKNKNKIGDTKLGGIIVSVNSDHGLVVALKDLRESTLSWKDAKDACNKLKMNGYDDWHLPTKKELNLLFKRRDVIGNLSPTYYWSSTEKNNIDAWNQNMSTGFQFTIEKFSKNNVRAVRSF